MSSVSSVSGYSYVDYGNIASGKKINSASDGAAESSIIQKEDTQVRGLNAGASNIATAKDMLNVSDGALSGIADYLQRIRELAVQASNTATMSNGDRKNIQKEIEQLKQGISDISSNTSFNTKKLLDGSDEFFQIAMGSNGESMKVNKADATLKALGIADFDVTKKFDIRTIDNAIDKVSSARSSVGAQANALDYAYQYNTNASYQLSSAKSRLEDLDIGEAISEKKKQQTLQEYALFMQKKRQEEEENQMRNWFA